MIRLPDDFLFTDYRGLLRATHFNKLGVPFRPVQMLVVHNEPGVFRGLHIQENLKLRKAVFCIEGLIHDFALNTKTGKIERQIITKHTNGVLIDGDEAHGYYSPGKSTVLYFYDMPYRQEWQTGYSAAGICRAMGVVPTLSDQDLGWPEWKLKEEKSPSSQEPPSSNTEE